MGALSGLTGLNRTDSTESAPQLYVLMGSAREWSQMSTAAPAVANLSSSQWWSIALCTSAHPPSTSAISLSRPGQNQPLLLFRLS